ncbi:hypothetical protein FB451DRAFT_68521 [Mycena latifolia]|nr:hypothetical protein FB451DRAFT_68521 [Mycena latifolia]
MVDKPAVVNAVQPLAHTDSARSDYSNPSDSLGGSTAPSDLPLELFVRVLLNLSYLDLVYVSAVAKHWNNVVEADPSLRVQRFKKASQVYVEPGDQVGGNETEPESESLRMHPVMSKVNFVLGNKVERAEIFSFGNARTSVPDSAVAHDLVSIPAVKCFTIEIEERTDVMETAKFQIEVKNPKGVTVLDVFTQLAKGTRRRVKTPGRWMSMADALMPQMFYESFCSLKRTGTTLSASLILGSLI